MVTIKDIACEAGVSHPTVSLVLNGKAKQSRISDEVARRICETAKRLGYARNELARSMVTGRNEVIAFVAADMGLIEYTGRIQNGILSEVSAHNYSLKLYRLDKNNQIETTKALIAQRVSGVIFHCARHEDFADVRKELEQVNIPVAIVNLSNNGKTGFGVTTDDYQGAFDAIKYLTELGHRKITHITYDNNSEYVVNRRNGYLDGMKKYSDEKPLILHIPEFAGIAEESSWHKNSLKEITSQGVTAIFCAQDTLAMKVFGAAYSLNIRIPEELSIIGFGDMNMGAYAPVPLTSIAQPFEEMGRLAALKIIEHKEKSLDMKLETKLVLRESTSKIIS